MKCRACSFSRSRRCWQRTLRDRERAALRRVSNARCCIRLKAVFSFLFFLLVVAADYALITKVFAKDAWQADWAIKIFSGGMVAASILSNFLMIYKKIDAWLWWVVYSLAGMVLYALMGNVFSFVLFTVFLIVNGGVGVIWFRLSKKH